ncbi:FAD-dependent oxidoreductase [candidate division GN15 bacterium]|nr:FAD-dependent oxidoreductase [candidate division GN15 bacterium]
MNTSAAGSCIVVGAGISGIMAARKLHQFGMKVTVIDKGRNFGGRMATRQMNGSRLDHGALSIMLDTPDAERIFKPLIDDGIIQPWYIDERQRMRYHGADGMASLIRHLGHGLDVHLSSRVDRISTVDGQWHVRFNEQTTLQADMLLLTPPVPQSLALSADSDMVLDPDVYTRLNRIRYEKCLTLMVIYDRPIGLPYDGFLAFGHPAAMKIVNNKAKGLTSQTAITIQASPEFSEQHFETPSQEVEDLMLSAVALLTNSKPLEQRLHRWRYSQAVTKDLDYYLMTTNPAPLAFTGDSFAGRQLTGAAVSGLKAAEALHNYGNVTA